MTQKFDGGKSDEFDEWPSIQSFPIKILHLEFFDIALF